MNTPCDHGVSEHPIWAIHCLDFEQFGFSHCFSDVSQNFEST